ncbi:MAG: M20 family metallo-hydrolase [Solirubrobacterales bacterium]
MASSEAAASASPLSLDITAAAQFGTDGGLGVTRLAWSPELMEVSGWLIERLESLGLAAELDQAGNVIGRWNAGEGKAVVVGSHLDTVPCGGRFDGALGVLCGVEAIRLLKESGFTPARPIWLTSFMDEEGARFRSALFGSRAFVGEPLADLGDRRDAEGLTLREAMAAAGFEFDRIGEAKAIDQVDSYLELHIEQGQVLEKAGVEVGFVTGLAGVLGLRATLRGSADHAGATPMSDRRDALVGAAQAVLNLRDQAARDLRTVRITVGTIRVEPGGFNVIPGSCEFTIDMRATGTREFAEAEEQIVELLGDVATAEGLELELARTHRQPPHEFDPRLIQTFREAAATEGASGLDLASGAGHDATVVGRYVPAAMLFVPSRDGVSHNPAEYTTPEQCDTGARVLSRALAALADGDAQS